MENKKAAIIALAVAATLILTVNGVNAMMVRTTTATTNSYPNTTYRSGMGPVMMGGGSTAYRGGMMNGYGMMGAGYSESSMMREMQQYMWHYWNSTSVP